MHQPGSPLLKTLSWDNRGLAESFAKYLVRRPKNRVGAKSTVCRYLRDLSAVFNKYSGKGLKERVQDYFLTFAKVEITRKFGLRVEPKRKEALNPSGFTCIAHFSWVWDRGQSCPLPISQVSTPKRRYECIFCKRSFPRKGRMWDCTERHLKRRSTEVVPCPIPECKSKGTVLENEMRFKNHAKVVHGRDLRPKIIIRTRTATNSPESLKSTPTIVLVRREESTRSPRIVLRVGKRPA